MSRRGGGYDPFPAFTGIAYIVLFALMALGGVFLAVEWVWHQLFG